MESPLFNSFGYFNRRFNEVSRSHAFEAEDVDEWRRWRNSLRRKLRQLLGLNSMEKVALAPRITEEVDCGDYVRQRVEIQTGPGLIMPLYALIPKAGTPPRRSPYFSRNNNGRLWSS